MALFRNGSPGALTFEQAVRKAEWLEELQRRRNAAEAYHRQGRAVPPELEDESPPEDFSKPERTNLFRNGSPGALTVEQAIARHAARVEQERRRLEARQKAKAEPKARAKNARIAEMLAAEGRGDDTEVAHVTPGEMVIPRVFQTPEVLAALTRVAAAEGVPLERFRVGAARNNINPNTGAPEFDLSDRDLDSIGRAISIAGSSMFSGDPWSGMSSHFDRWSSTPLTFTASNGVGGVSGPGADTSGSAPYRYDGPETDGITVTGKPWPAGNQALAWPTTHGGIIGGDDYGFAGGRTKPHNGVDLRSRINQHIFSVVDGTIEETGYDERNGNYIRIRDAGGNLYGYAHTGSAPGVSKGLIVRAGDRIGFSDGSGKSLSGAPIPPHLHFTYRPGTPDAPATPQSPVADPHAFFFGLGGLRPTS